MRLMGIIERSRGCKSKALTVLANRSNALCDKQKKEIKKWQHAVKFPLE